MERQSKESRGLEAYCREGQGPPRAVAPSGGGFNVRIIQETVIQNVVFLKMMPQVAPRFKRGLRISSSCHVVNRDNPVHMSTVICLR